MAEPRPALTAGEVADICGVSRYTVLNWIKQDLLEAYSTPGNHNRIQASKLLEFLREHDMPVPEELDPSPPTVLVVDDEETVREVSRRALEKDELHVVEAANGYEACIMVGDVKPDVVLLDLKMPKVDGFEVCRRIKTNPATADCKVVAVTGFATEENVDKIIECGAEEVLRKPVDIDDLRAKVRELLG